MTQENNNRKIHNHKVLKPGAMIINEVKAESKQEE